MPRNAGTGDRLARGATRASYLANENNNVTDDKWKAAFDDFDPEKFQKEGMPKVKGEKKTNVETRRS